MAPPSGCKPSKLRAIEHKSDLERGNQLALFTKSWSVAPRMRRRGWLVSAFTRAVPSPKTGT